MIRHCRTFWLVVTAVALVAGCSGQDRAKAPASDHKADANADAEAQPSQREAAAFAETRTYLEAGGNPDAVAGEYGNSHLNNAARSGFPSVVRLLLRHGANVNSRNGWDSTPLHDAAYGCKPDVARLLLRRGADIDPRNEWGRTPVSLAAENGYLPVVELLLEQGADANTADEMGFTPLHWAVLERWGAIVADPHGPRDFPGTVRLLARHGVDVNARSERGETPLDLLKPDVHGDMIQLLRGLGGSRALEIIPRVPMGFKAAPGTKAEPYSKTGWAKEIIEPITGMRLAFVPVGKFMMGSPETEKGREKDEGPQRQVTIPKPFYMGVHEVTRGQFERFVADCEYKTDAEEEGWAWAWAGEFYEKVNGASWRKPGFEQTDEHPVTEVTHNDATDFCAWLAGRKGVGVLLPTEVGVTVRLPTEAQWEYACRAGSTTRFSFGDDDADLHKHGNYCERSCSADHSWKVREHTDGHGKTAPVGNFKPNAFGLYDMHGNVMEWCSDWYAASYADERSRDPQGPGSGTYRVLRGSSWFFGPTYCRSANRRGLPPDSRNYYLGFRIVVELK